MPDIRILPRGRLIGLIQKSAVAIIDHLGTTALEALTINIPTIWFLNVEVNLIRPEAEKYFALLRDAGILHRSPEEAAEKVNEIYNDPLRWWCNPEVQKAKNTFCDRFALTSNNWRKEWVDALNVYK